MSNTVHIQRSEKGRQDIKGVPDRSIYKQNYGAPYKTLRWICIPGIVYYILGIILHRTAGILIPGIGNIATGWIISVWCTASIAGIPLSIFVERVLSFNKYKNDYCMFREDDFVYYRQMINRGDGGENLDVVEEFRVAEMSNKSFETKGWFKIRGVIERTVIRNGKRGKMERKSGINIPKLFTNMKEIYKYPFIEETKGAKQILKDKKYSEFSGDAPVSGRTKNKEILTWQKLKNRSRQFPQ